MKKYIGIALAVLMVLVFVAAPAFGDLTGTTNVSLEIEAYAYVTVDQAAITVTLSGGATEGGGGIWGSVVCNKATTISAAVVKDAGPGDWTIRDQPTSACPVGQTFWACYVEVKNVPFDTVPQGATPSATVTFTVVAP